MATPSEDHSPIWLRRHFDRTEESQLPKALISPLRDVERSIDIVRAILLLVGMQKKILVDAHHLPEAKSA